MYDLTMLLPIALFNSHFPVSGIREMNLKGIKRFDIDPLKSPTNNSTRKQIPFSTLRKNFKRIGIKLT